MNFRRPWGFAEWLPSQQYWEDRALACLADMYRRSGFVSIQTPAVESNEVLLSRGGADAMKQIFGLYGLAQGLSCAQAGAPVLYEAFDPKEYSLHFDLTVPFARYVVEHANDLVFPFKRYQIQKVWRGERPQKHRYREFCQADVDMLFRGDFSRDAAFAEVVLTLHNAVQALETAFGFALPFAFHISHRGVWDDFAQTLGWSQEQKLSLMRAFDDIKKQSKEDFLLQIQSLCAESFDDFSRFFVYPEWNMPAVLAASPAAQKTHDLCASLSANGVNVVFDLSILRGLDYYTSFVFEGMWTADSSITVSLAGGGVYDDFVRVWDQSLSWVGGSIGITRLLSVLFEKDAFVSHDPSFIDVAFVALDDASYNERSVLAQSLRRLGLRVEVLLTADKLGKQFEYAQKKGAVACILIGETERQNQTCVVKVLGSTEQTVFAITDAEAIYHSLVSLRHKTQD